MATPNQVTGYDPQSLQIIQMDTAQTETPLPTEEEYLKDMLRVWCGRKNAAVASRDARAPAAKQQPASRPQQAQGKDAPSVTSQRANQLQWRPKNTPRIEKDDIIVVLKPRETLDLEATCGPGQACAAVRSILGADATVGLAVWPFWDQNVLVCTLKSVDATERLLRDIELPVGGRQLTFRGHPKLSGKFCRGVVHVSQDETSETVKSKLSAEPNVVSVRKLGDTPVAVITFAGTKVPRTVLYNCERLPVRLYKKTVPACPLCGTVGYRADTRPRLQPGRCTSCGVQVPAATPDGPTEHQIPMRIQAEENGEGGGNKQAPTLKTGPKKAPAAKSNKPEPKKTNTGHSTNGKSVTPSEPPVLVKDFPPLTPVQAQVSRWGGAVSGPSPSPSPIETALQQQIGELRRPNRILARKIQELEAKQVGSSEPVQEAEAEDGDDGPSLTPRLISVSRQDAYTVVGPASITGSIGRIESLERKTIRSERGSPPHSNNVSNSVLKAVPSWVIAQIKNTTQSDSPQGKRKPASRQAAEEGFSGPASGPDRSFAP
ncbi:hypothetical protein HPB51_012147 [Rhipicephalus microplus]|uniref:Uncharacterized protein n=1 Tax=Rhipicephalus microplus TaxID=6941 RepID=A0A9J6DV69_RHIMP|nr:hypothetical protein HPB51_012147 [Rhipicephalus microplus]